MNIDDYAPLETYTRDSAEQPRPDALATISAGWKNEKGLPTVSRDGQIILHDPEGRAPGLAKALEATGGKRLIIAFPINDPNVFIQQRFAAYSATALLAYGDKHQIVTMDGNSGNRMVLTPDMAEFETVVKQCKVVRSVYFVLAKWGPNGEPQMVFPDAFPGYYRLRFTSHNSIRSILATLRDVSRFTGGRIAGIPFTLALDYRDVADARGTRHRAPVWTIAMQPPGTITLTSANFAAITERALRQGQALMLPQPTVETMALAIAEGPEPDLDETVIEPSEAETERLAAGGHCDKDFWLKTWFGRVKGTIMDDDHERAEFLLDFTDGQTSSLADFLDGATEAEAAALIATMLGYLEVKTPAPTEDTALEGDHHHDPRPLTSNERAFLIAKGMTAEEELWGPKPEPGSEFDAAGARERVAHKRAERVALNQIDRLVAETHPPQKKPDTSLIDYRPAEAKRDIQRIALGLQIPNPDTSYTLLGSKLAKAFVDYELGEAGPFLRALWGQLPVTNRQAAAVATWLAATLPTKGKAQIKAAIDGILAGEEVGGDAPLTAAQELGLE